MMTETRILQTWPGGASYEYRGDPHGPADQRTLRTPGRNGEPTGRWRKGTADEWRAILIETRAEMYRDRDVLACLSSLVDDLIKHASSGDLSGDLAEGFAYDEIRNLYKDPSAWTLEECHAYAHDDHGLDTPDPNPWSMNRAAIVEALTDASIECRDDDESTETLREALIANIDDETIAGLDDWREVCREHTQENAAEVYEWWLVSSWLCDQLHAIGEVTIDNGYGHYWGRCTTGQSMIMDGVLQRVAASLLD